MGNEFAIAEGIRVQVTNEQARQIRSLYQELANEYRERARILSNKSNVSSYMREQYLKDYAKDLERDIEYLNSRLEGTITSNMLRVAEAVVDDSLKLDKEMGFGGIMTKQFYIPQDVVAVVTSGQLYSGKWTLSGAIWSENQKKLNDINSIVAKGIAGNKSAYEIAKDLERYVNPRARKEWNWNKVYPNTSKKIDYNAQRLARTMVAHAYQESFVESTKDNPFIESYRWLASGGDRMCPICADRDGQIYSKDDLPMDHPNGMCTFEVVIEKSYEEIGRELADWVNGEGDPELNEAIDNYAESLGIDVKPMTANTEPVSPYNEVIEEARTLLTEYVNGTGENIADTFDESPEALQYIKDHMQEYSDKTFYRIERTRHTAADLMEGEIFKFNGDLRSFTGSKDGLRAVLEDASSFADLGAYTLFKTVGKQEAFDVNAFINNAYYADQDEFLLGGKFQVMKITQETFEVVGQKVTLDVMEIRDRADK